MLTLRSCSPVRLISPPHRYISISSLLVSFPFPKSSFIPNPHSLWIDFHPKSTMSKPPSAFATLMAGARAAAAADKKKSQSKSQSQVQSSPKKRKTPDSQNPAKTLTSSGPVEELPTTDSKPARVETQELDEEMAIKAENPVPENPNLSVVKLGEEKVNNAKKQRIDIGELKIKIKELKKSPGDFKPKNMVSWGKGEKVPFIFVCSAFESIEEESGRILITNVACNMLRTVMDTTPDDLLALVYLLANRVAPAHEGVELGIGEAMIIKALGEAFGRTEKQVKKEYEKTGDLGLVAQASRSSQSMMRKPDPLTVSKVFNTFRLIAKESGKDSQDKKKNHIKALLVAATDCEPLYLIRLLQGKLRLNLAGKTLLAALGQATVYAEKHSATPSDIQSPLEEAAKIVKQVYSVLPVYDIIVPALLADGVWNLPKTCAFTPGVPIGPMLAKATNKVSDIVEKFQNAEFTCEYKYDGERAQIHYLENGSVEIYSRNAERNTSKYPDVVAAITRLKRSSVKSFVLDCEIVAYNRDEKRILPFQILTTRPRKNVAMSDIKVNVCIFAFDILYLDGEPLLQEQLELRRQRLYNSFEEEVGLFQFATAITSNDLEEIQKFLDASVDASCEGLIIKTLNKDATYEPSKRSLNWLKLKKDYMENIGDSLDLVPIAAFHGRGKRTGCYGAFLLACYDNNSDEYQSICKIGTGFSEQMLEERSNSLRSRVISKPKPYYRFGEKPEPDVWFEPSEVWEVKAADLTISPVHRAAVGLVNSEKGISLRFPRLIRVREDKSPEQATSSEQVADMYNAQKHTQPNNQGDNEDDD
ncbi:DNA ligase 1-like [Euphorbia lathyris]|uniref:DNA ligase 1-like n=1 Tax=Euphorbia lathyris TaxID=212925 RepID=UPI00331425C6